MLVTTREKDSLHIQLRKQTAYNQVINPLHTVPTVPVGRLAANHKSFPA